MKVDVLIQFVAKYGNKDIDKKFDALKEYKNIYMLKPTTERKSDIEWLYN